MDDISQRLAAHYTHIAHYCAQAGRDAAEITLLAVSKTVSSTKIRAAAQAGQRAFGESYVQEALPKIAALADLPLIWHFIGALQSNKTRAVATHFHWVHSVDRCAVAIRLNAQRPSAAPPLNVCLQYNVSQEQQKAGADAAMLTELAACVADLPRLKLRGLMALPAPSTDFTTQRAAFAEVRAAYEDLIARGYDLDTLSMGTSHDYPAALAAGATIIRLGSAVFGPRS